MPLAISGATGRESAQSPARRAMHMPRNVVICCDGTSNQPASDMTNLAKLYFALQNDALRQITFYHPGLGTTEPVDQSRESLSAAPARALCRARRQASAD